MRFFSKTPRLAAAVLITVLGTLSSCSKKGEAKDKPFMKIGKKTYMLSDFKTFTNMQYNHYNLVRDGFFPGEQFAPTLFAQTELLYKDAKKYSGQVMKGKEWEWKKEFLLGQFYQRNVVRPNLGATDEELKKHFKANRGTILYESGKGSDTSFLANAKQIIESRFLQYYPPTPEFAKSYKGISETEIKKYWLDTQQKRRVAFFRDLYYQEYYKKPYPQDYKEFFGPGKEITAEDLAIIAKWLPTKTRDKIKDPATESEMAHFMMTWKLFARKAKEKGIDRSAQYKGQFAWFEKYELVSYYLNTVMKDKLAVDRSEINPEIVQFAVWDQKGRTEASAADSVILNKIYDETVALKSNAAMLKMIADKRKKKGVTYLDPDYKDETAQPSDRVLFEADSVNNLGNKEMAKKLYRDLIRYYPFTKEGVEAYRALAMIDTDEGVYSTAIRNYRNYLLLSEPSDEWCKVFFMTAYAYGEYLSNADLASVNYRWVLKNRPDCDFADDAEFMYLHLGEPVSDIDELQAENLRQGRTDIK